MIPNFFSLPVVCGVVCRDSHEQIGDVMASFAPFLKVSQKLHYSLTILLLTVSYFILLAIVDLLFCVNTFFHCF